MSRESAAAGYSKVPGSISIEAGLRKDLPATRSNHHVCRGMLHRERHSRKPAGNKSPRSSLEGGNMINCQLRSCLSCHCIPGGLSPQLLEGAHFLLRLGGLALRPVNGCQEKMNRWLGRAILLGHK